MASIYKRIGSDCWYITYSPRPHVRKTVAGCKDYKATQAVARKLEDEARQIRRGAIDQRAERLGKSEDRPLVEKDANGKVTGGHLADFIAAMRGKGGTENHITRTERFIAAMLDTCGIETASDLDGAKVSAHVADLKREGRHARAINARLTALKSFTRWMFRNERTRTDPMMQVAKLNAKADRQHVRRAFTDDELTRLIDAAKKGAAWTWQQGNAKTGDGYRLESMTIDGSDRAVAKSLARHSTITLTMDHYTHTLIGDDRAALDRLPTMTPATPPLESEKATGTDNAAAGDDPLLALLLARKDPETPKLAIIRQHRRTRAKKDSASETPVNAGVCHHSPLSYNERGPLAQRLEQGTHNPLVQGSNP